MDFAWLFPWLLFLHVLGAIVAFGPTFAFPIIGAMGGKEPQHANFATRISQSVSARLVYPIGITLPITGALIILVSGIEPDRTARTGGWPGDRALHDRLRLFVLRPAQDGRAGHRDDLGASAAGRERPAAGAMAALARSSGAGVMTVLLLVGSSS